MKREEAIKTLTSLKEQYEIAVRATEHVGIKAGFKDAYDAINTAIAALRSPTREQVERMRGEWVIKHRHHGGFHRVTGVDDTGEQHTITIDERCEYDDLYCSKCGKQSPDNFLDFCGCCGAPMTDEAVDIVMQRLEALHENDR